MILGSGKTLAYLAPLISRLRDEEEGCGLVPRLRRPRALVLVPSRDLAAQVLGVAKSLCHVARFRAIGLIGGVKRVSIYCINPVCFAIMSSYIIVCFYVIDSIFNQFFIYFPQLILPRDNELEWR